MFRFFTNADNLPHGLSQEQLSHLEGQITNCTDEQVGQTCSICLETLEHNSHIINLDCSHFFHSNCLLRWYTESSTCPICRSNESEQTHTIRLPLEQLLMMSTEVSLIFYYPNNIRQVTNWNTHTTIVEILQYIGRSCNTPNPNLQIRSDSNVFKTTESFSYLNQPLLVFNVSSGTEFIISFF